MFVLQEIGCFQKVEHFKAVQVREWDFHIINGEGKCSKSMGIVVED